ncbi:Rim4p ASCRUDRAFT_75616 [Ascoidea rubescens DSM 1968]|uniref:RRM domain-containing protein n=1 Tax=Ascoidea rubescens DSM 1968 TaxID=1344418 RepID=A0A1D2VJ13_9ASCO|nr:hypothetical protein ASCRUDRAFT_75616 [Ascoidea rubescens DSM 1968]ODV61624.1 hypothetical protein ASCRUDRAFT_75616 [Ascoidea rubescens DSM 1968]
MSKLTDQLSSTMMDDNEVERIIFSKPAKTLENYNTVRQNITKLLPSSFSSDESLDDDDDDDDEDDDDNQSDEVSLTDMVEDHNEDQFYSYHETTSNNLNINSNDSISKLSQDQEHQEKISNTDQNQDQDSSNRSNEKAPFRGRPSSCVFVASLAATKSDNELYNSVFNHFKKWGEIAVKVLRDPSNRPYAFVQYTNDEDAKKALREAQHSMLDGRSIRCEPAKVNRTLYIATNSGYDLQSNDVCDMMEEYGEIEQLVGNNSDIRTSILPINHHDPNSITLNKAWFVKFAYRDDAIRAYVNLYRNPEWIVQWAKNIEAPDETINEITIDKNSIYVGQLDSRVTKEKLEERFSAHGKIADISLVQKQTNNFAFIKFENEISAAAAVERENHAIFMDKTMHVQYKEMHHHNRHNQYNLQNNHHRYSAGSIYNEQQLTLAPPPINLPVKRALNNQGLYNMNQKIPPPITSHDNSSIGSMALKAPMGQFSLIPPPPSSNQNNSEIFNSSLSNIQTSQRRSFSNRGNRSVSYNNNRSLGSSNYPYNSNHYASNQSNYNNYSSSNSFSSKNNLRYASSKNNLSSYKDYSTYSSSDKDLAQNSRPYYQVNQSQKRVSSNTINSLIQNSASANSWIDKNNSVTSTPTPSNKNKNPNSSTGKSPTSSPSNRSNNSSHMLPKSLYSPSTAISHENSNDKVEQGTTTTNSQPNNLSDYSKFNTSTSNKAVSPVSPSYFYYMPKEIYGFDPNAMPQSSAGGGYYPYTPNYQYYYDPAGVDYSQGPPIPSYYMYYPPMRLNSSNGMNMRNVSVTTKGSTHPSVFSNASPSTSNNPQSTISGAITKDEGPEY